jgi:ATP-dependent phosphoenolpyruvate carboxykinase
MQSEDKYAELLAAKMKQHDTRVWLVNTGWSGGAYGTGKRIKLARTRAIVDAIHSGALAKARSSFRAMSGTTEPPTRQPQRSSQVSSSRFAAYEAVVSDDVKQPARMGNLQHRCVSEANQTNP